MKVEAFERLWLVAGGGGLICRFGKRRSLWTLALVPITILGAAPSALAAFDGSELERTLAWLYVVPVGVFQLFAAFVVRKHVRWRPVRWTLMAILASLAVGLVTTIALYDSRGLVPVLTILILAPGVPAFVALARVRNLPFAFALLVLPPLLFILRIWDELWR